ncbi:MAG: DUF2786 domain-containing protein [Nannocystaceae bacterium]
MGRAKILERVRKLLRMARGQANEHESAVAAAMAERLMREHQIEQSQVILDDLSQGAGLGCEDVGQWRRCPDWQGLVAVATARLFDCEVDRCEHASAAGFEALRFYGYAADTIVAKWTFEYLVDEVQRRFDSYCASEAIAAEARLTARAEYRMGAAQSLLSTLAEATAAKRAEQAVDDLAGECSALITQSKEAAIREVFGAFTYLPTPLAERPALAFVRGRRDGQAIALRRGVDVGAPLREIK